MVKGENDTRNARVAGYHSGAAGGVYTCGNRCHPLLGTVSRSCALHLVVSSMRPEKSPRRDMGYSLRRQGPWSAPTAAELQRHPAVRHALEGAWQDSLPDEPARRHQEGGWIYMDITTGEISVRRQTAGRQASIDLSRPPILASSVVVGKFHTHPNPSREGWAPGPSCGDLQVDAFTACRPG